MDAKTFETRLSNLQFGLQTPWNPGSSPQRRYRKLSHHWSGERSVSFLRLEGPRRLQNRERHIRFCGRIRISLTLIDWRQHPSESNASGTCSPATALHRFGMTAETEN